jgi:hypothetical protein
MLAEDTGGGEVVAERLELHAVIIQRMAAEIPEITDSNHDELKRYLEHVVTDLHDALKMLRDQGVIQERHDVLLREFEPFLTQFRGAPAATILASRRARKAAANGRD